MKILQPVRVKRTYVQTLNASPDQVFPLLCPVRETEWVDGWDPQLVITSSGLIEPDGIFVMSDQPQDAIWVVTQRNPYEFFVAFIKVIPGFTVGKIEIQLRQGMTNQTLAEISYSYTALGKQGAEFVEQFTMERYKEFMQEWELELNHFLLTGTRLAKGEMR